MSRVEAAATWAARLTAYMREATPHDFNASVRAVSKRHSPLCVVMLRVVIVTRGVVACSPPCREPPASHGPAAPA